MPMANDSYFRFYDDKIEGEYTLAERRYLELNIIFFITISVISIIDIAPKSAALLIS